MKLGQKHFEWIYFSYCDKDPGDAVTIKQWTSHLSLKYSSSESSFPLDNERNKPASPKRWEKQANELASRFSYDRTN